MKFLKIFKTNTQESAEATAKERLTLILAHERTSNIEYIDDLKRDIMEVLERYTTPSDVSFRTSSHDNTDSLEIDIKL